MHLKFFCISCVFLGTAFFSYSQDMFTEMNLPIKSKQVIIVVSDGWNDMAGEIKLYEKSNRQWAQVGKSSKVVLGKNGLGWGRGLHHSSSDNPEKVEGDGRGVAGIFELGMAFGYENEPFQLKFPYKSTTERDYWIDDVHSEQYNSWVTISENQENNPGKYWNSFERMRRSDHLYEYGITVRHNMKPVIPGKGSAIFMHVWRRENSPTLGCTAMSKNDLLRILKWLDKEKHPILIQAPANVIQLLRCNK